VSLHSWYGISLPGWILTWGLPGWDAGSKNPAQQSLPGSSWRWKRTNFNFLMSPKPAVVLTWNGSHALLSLLFQMKKHMSRDPEEKRMIWKGFGLYFIYTPDVVIYTPVPFHLLLYLSLTLVTSLLTDRSSFLLKCMGDKNYKQTTQIQILDINIVLIILAHQDSSKSKGFKQQSCRLC
jgi:hypothetical protein